MGTFVDPDKICTAVSVLSGVVLFLELVCQKFPYASKECLLSMDSRLKNAGRQAGR